MVKVDKGRGILFFPAELLQGRDKLEDSHLPLLVDAVELDAHADPLGVPLHVPYVPGSSILFSVPGNCTWRMIASFILTSGSTWSAVPFIMVK